MPALFVATTQALPQAVALRVADALEALAFPRADAVATIEVDEAGNLWQVEAQYGFPPSTGDITRHLLDAGHGQLQVSVVPLPDTDWVANSLKGLPAVRAGRFSIHGSHEKPPAGSIALEVDAGTAFGTGHHGSTLGCLHALDRYLKQNRPRRILDIGCGTGVLAIAAARATRRPVLASDIDPEAVRVTRRNAMRNATGGLVTSLCAAGVHDKRIAARAPYDLIFANILARPLITLAPAISGLMAGNAAAILAGLTTSQERWVYATYRGRNLILERRVRLAGWSTLLLRKQNARHL